MNPKFHIECNCSVLKRATLVNKAEVDLLLNIPQSMAEPNISTTFKLQSLSLYLSTTRSICIKLIKAYVFLMHYWFVK